MLIYIIGLFIIISLLNLIVLMLNFLFNLNININVNIWAYALFNIIYFTWRLITYYFSKKDNEY